MKKTCVAVCNAALESIGAPLINQVSDIYTADWRFSTTDRLLDVYGARENIEYLGVLSPKDVGKPALWPPGDKPKVFVYLKAGYPHTEDTTLSMSPY